MLLIPTPEINPKLRKAKVFKRLLVISIVLVIPFAAIAGGSFVDDANAIPCLPYPFSSGPNCGGNPPPPPPPPVEPCCTTPPPPPPPVYAACSDGADNDGDGKVDYPADPGCADYGDPDEWNAAPAPPPPPPPISPPPPPPSTGPTDPYPGGFVYEDEFTESAIYTQWLWISGPTGVGTDAPQLVKVPCRDARYMKTAKAWAMPWEVAFRMHLELHFCWSGARIVNASSLCYSSLVNEAIQAGTCSTQGIPFSTPYDVKGGWHSVAQNTYKNCLPGGLGGWTCWREVTPTIHIYARAGGTWNGVGGDG